VRRRTFIISFCLATAAWPRGAGAQRPEKVYKIGLFSAGSHSVEPILQNAIRDGLSELGWVEGEGRYAEDRLDRLPALAAELVSLNVDVIVAVGTLAPLAAKQATLTIPIVMAGAGDPIGSGLVASLARPGGNVTGLSLMSPGCSRSWFPEFPGWPFFGTQPILIPHLPSRRR